MKTLSTVSFSTSVLYKYDRVTIDAAIHLRDVAPGTIAEHAHALGMRKAEPLIIAFDALIKYAKSYEKRWERKLAEDYVLGPEWLSSLQGLRGLLNGDGAVAYDMDRSTDSKDNGACESMFWSAMEIAGFKEEDLN